MRSEQEIRDRISIIVNQRGFAEESKNYRAASELFTAETFLRWSLGDAFSDDESGYWECGNCGGASPEHATGGTQSECLWRPHWVATS